MLESLLHDLEHGIYKKRRNAADILGQMKDKRAVDPLILVLEKEWDDDVVIAAVRALGQIGDDRAIEPLQKLYNEQYDERIANEIKTSLMTLCPSTSSELVSINRRKSRIATYFERLRNEIPNAGYAYHFTDVLNLGNILSEGFVYSRNNVTRKTLLVTQGGDKDIIDKAPSWVKHYVRCYLRPRPPMLYNVEGIKNNPSEDKWRGRKKPHIPIPVYLIFDLISLFDTVPQNEVVLFDGNAASSSSSCSKDEDLTPLEFLLLAIDWPALFIDQIYSGDYYANNKRQAEILIKERLSIELCSMLVFRSIAERNLAQQLIPKISKYHLRIDKDFYNCRETYVEDFKIKGSQMVITIKNYRPGYRLLCEFTRVNDSKKAFTRLFHQKDEATFLHGFSNLENGRYRFDLYIFNEEGKKFLVYRDNLHVA